MRCTVQVTLETEAGTQVTEIACVQRETAAVEALGLTLAEGNALLAGLQEVLVAEQAAEYLATRQACSQCGRPLRHKGHHPIVFRTLFGNTTLPSPRLYRCPCQGQPTRTFSPLTELLPTHTSPERLYLETKWAALISFDLTAQLMAEVLPVDRHINPASERNDLQRVATRAEAALGEERGSFIDGCPMDITFIPMRRGFVCLAAVLDWAARRVLAWRLSNSMTVDFCLDALDAAVRDYGPPGILNTDQGSQFTGTAFVGVTQQHGIQLSMDGKGAWRDNRFILHPAISAGPGPAAPHASPAQSGCASARLSFSNKAHHPAATG
jgi:hypothetical protein